MALVRPIKHLPINFGAFVEEVSAGMEEVYGPAAAEEYRSSGAAKVLATVTHPGVRATAVLDGRSATAMLLSIVHENVGQIFFLHVLRGHERDRPERALLTESVSALRREPIDGIVCETLIFNPIDACEVLNELGFEHFERAVMRGPLNFPGLLGNTNREMSRPLDPYEHAEVAEVLVEAYRADPGIALHREMASHAGALRLVESVTTGAFGAYRREFGRCVEVDGRIVSILLGCEAASRVGFVVQVATRPQHRSKGFAESLMCDTATAFRMANLEHMALGVTLSNPAIRLYERLGLTIRRRVDAYVWWREADVRAIDHSGTMRSHGKRH